MSYRFLGIDTSSKRLVQFVDPAVSYSLRALRERQYWAYCPHFVERWEWLASTDASARKREFYRKYCGRTGSIWKSEYAELNPANWTEPLVSTGNNTQQPSPWNNSIHLRNSKDGTTLDELYFAPRIWMKPPCVLNFDAYFPALNTTNYPNGTYIALGFEVNSGGYIGELYAFEILSDGTTVTARLRGLGIRGSSGAEVVQSISGLVTDDWRGFKLILLPYALQLWQGTVSGQGYPIERVGELPITLDYISTVQPFFANESSTIVDGVYIGQFQAYEIQAPAVNSIHRRGISIWDWPSTITVPAGTSISGNTEWSSAGGHDVFYKSGVSGYVEAVMYITDNVGQPMLWLYIDDWDVLAMGHWGVTHQFGVYEMIRSSFVGGDHPPRYKCEFMPRMPIYFKNSVGIKFSNTDSVDHYVYFVLIMLRFVSPDIIGRPKNEISAYNDVASDHIRS